MKKFITILLLILIVNGASSQVRFGVRAMYDVSETKFSSHILDAENRLGYQVGPTLEATIPASGFGGELSVLYGYKKFKITEKERDATLFNYEYVTIPLHVKQRFQFTPMFGLFVSGGPYGEVKLNSSKLEGQLNDALHKYKTKDFTLGGSLRAGVQFLGHFEVAAQYRLELTKRFKNEFIDEGNIKDKRFQTWSLGMTYFF